MKNTKKYLSAGVALAIVLFVSVQVSAMKQRQQARTQQPLSLNQLTSEFLNYPEQQKFQLMEMDVKNLRESDSSTVGIITAILEVMSKEQLEQILNRLSPTTTGSGKENMFKHTIEMILRKK